MANLQERLIDEFGRREITRRPMPDSFDTSLSPSKPLRPYQEACFKYFLTYMDPENDFDFKLARPHLLFHMATGSGKTLVMAGAIIYLYELGYRNFLFFVDSTNIVEKTKDNFLNSASAKYLFAPQIRIGGKQVEIKKVDNFQKSDRDCINLCLTTIQGLHTAINTPHENSITYEDFSSQPVVLISDEAHHMNSATRSGDSASEEEISRNWETTVMRIFNKDNGSMSNILLEFTATADLADPLIAQKYEDKVIFDYPLKHFREDLYSKEVSTIERDLEPMGRVLQAVILSQFKRKLFATIKQNIKPTILIKSKTIRDNAAVFGHFQEMITNLVPADIEKIRNGARDDMKVVFDYFDANGITDENLILELKEDFASDRLLLVDQNAISPQKQILLNSLEEPWNEIRVIFAVDMLNEGWDVLNLFDIVRLYNSRDARDGRPGKTTMQEAQLIGRGARYMPFIDPANPGLEFDKRKYDNDASNPLRFIETLHYHCDNNPRYINELRNALVKTGIIPSSRVQRDLFMKDDFKQTRLYKKGLVFMNERKPVSYMESDGTIGAHIKEKVFRVNMPTGKMRTGLIFGDNASTEVITSNTFDIRMRELGKHILRAAVNSFSTYNYSILKNLLPDLKSTKDFIESDDYLANLQIKVTGRESSLAAYSQDDKLFIAKSVLKEIEPVLQTRGKTYKGTYDFTPKEVKKVFRDKISLTFSIPQDGSQQEFGVSMRDSVAPHLRADLSSASWYAYNDNYGTAEEKSLLKFIESKIESLRDKYDEVYLLRNEKDVKIYGFTSGQAFEPDFVLFMRIKGSGDKYDNLQFFIEPKGEHLRKAEIWKEDFLKEMHSKADIRWCTQSDQYAIWGLPFYTESKNEDFLNDFKEIVEEYVPEAPEAPSDTVVWAIIQSEVVPAEQKYKTYLPVYSVRAACGGFDNCGIIPESEAEGWIDVSGKHIKANKNMFIVHASGNSMLPLIKDGDLCVFEFYGPELSGSRDGQVVLTQSLSKDDDYGCSYTIKKYHSEKEIDDDGNWFHTKVELQPLNTVDFAPIELSPENADDYRTIGILKDVL